MPKVRLKKGLSPHRAIHFPKGRSIRDIVLSLNPESGEWETPTVCFLNNAPVLRGQWDSTRLSGRDDLMFVTLPMGGGGGGSNPLKTILSLTIAAVAVATGGLVAGLVGGGLLGAAAGALATGAVMALGGSITGGLARPSGQVGAIAAEQASPTYSLGGFNNAARLEQPVPEGFGRMKIVPDRVTWPYCVYQGNEQYMHLVFALGRGECEVEQMMFGDSIFWRKAQGVDAAYDVQVQFRTPGQKVTLFPDNVEVSSEVAGQTLLAPNEPEYKGWIGPFSANPPGTVTTRIVNNLILPNGLGYINSNGALRQLSQSYRFECRRINDYGQALSGWSTLTAGTLTLTTRTPQRISLETSVTEGRYEVRATVPGNVNHTSGRHFYTTQWESMQAILPGSLTYDQSVVALRVRATNTLSQKAANSFSVIQTRKLPVYDRTSRTWSAPGPTRSFAAAVSQVARADYGGGLPDSRIDLDALWAIDEELGARGWTFDGYFDGPYTIWNLLLEMCQPFGVVPRLSGGVLTFIQDRPGRPVRHIFTPENIVRGSLSVTYNTFTSDTPDDVTVAYLDEEAAFQQRDVSAALPDSESRSPASKTFIGVVKRRQAFEMGLKMAAANRHRRLSFRWRTEAVGRLINMGDVAALSHPSFAAVESGTVQGFDESSLTLNLGRPLGLPTGENRYLALNGRDGRPWGPALISRAEGDSVTLDAADYALIRSQGSGNPFDWVSDGRGAFPTIWTVQSGREISGRVIITQVAVVDRFHYEITALNDAPEAYGYQDLEPEPWHYRVSQGAQPELAAPEGFSATVTGEPETPVINLTWLPVPGALSYAVEYSCGGGGRVSAPAVAINALTLAVEPGAAAVWVAAVSGEKQGPWGRWNGNTGDMFLPPVEVRAQGAYTGGSLTVRWDAEVSDPSVYQYRLTVTPAGQSGPVRTVTLAAEDLAYTYTPAMGLADGGPWRELVVGLEALTLDGDTAVSTLGAEDPPPPAPENLAAEARSDRLILTGAEVTGEHTGFVIVRGDSPDFDLSGVLETRVTSSLPYSWTGLAPQTNYYFRLAAKDAFYDLCADHLALNYTEVLVVTTAGIS